MMAEGREGGDIKDGEGQETRGRGKGGWLRDGKPGI